MYIAEFGNGREGMSSPLKYPIVKKITIHGLTLHTDGLKCYPVLGNGSARCDVYDIGKDLIDSVYHDTIDMDLKRTYQFVKGEKQAIYFFVCKDKYKVYKTVSLGDYALSVRLRKG